MFCSKCGKTLLPDAVSCPFCKLDVGASRFEGTAYTSAQAHILPGDDVHQVLTKNYTRTTYTRTPEMADRGAPDTRTTYRPTYNGDSVPEDMRRDIDAEKAGQTDIGQTMESVVRASVDEPLSAEREEEEISQGASSSLDALDEELTMEDLDLSKFRSKPIESAGQSGISSEVNEMFQAIEEEANRQAARKQAKQQARQIEDIPQDVPTDDLGAVDGETTPPDGEVIEAVEPETEDVAADIDDFEDERGSGFGLKQILKIVAAVIVVAALVIGGVLWLNYIRSNHSNSPIENVREDLYTQGVALIKEHAQSQTEQQMLDNYTDAGNDLATLSTSLSSMKAQITALTPEDATDNEKLYMQALTRIDNNIANCITSDAMALTLNEANAQEESDARWEVVNNSIAMLQSATSATELTAIINGEVVDVKTAVQATPSPTPAPNYNTLSKGDESDEVMKLQERLIELGYLSDTADGQFGSKTQTAVKIFQQMNGLPVTGVADEATLDALYDENAKSAASVNTSGTVTTATDAPDDGSSEGEDGGQTGAQTGAVSGGISAETAALFEEAEKDVN